MNDLQKLKHLISHWKEHNEEHAKTYMEWSRKAEEAGKREVASLLRELAEGTMRLSTLFGKADDLL